ncbi:MAG TPA: STN domain-containing protein, partial [Rhizomicrobium sp.]|nr:STN domain-containing protein [Rhizomicrobium sp.]
MRKLQILKSVLAGTASALLLAGAAQADDFDIPAGDLKAALNSFAAQTGLNLIVSDDVVRGARTPGAHGDFTASVALTRILQGTGLAPRRTTYGAVAIVKEQPTAKHAEAGLREIAATAPAHAAAAGSVETVVVTSSKI